jgi:hypothetical protein
MQVVATPCAKICMPTAVSLGSAQFGNDGVTISVPLSAVAAPWGGPCSMIFDATTMQLLGSSSDCVAFQKDLRIFLGGDATVGTTNSMLSLSVNQTQLVDILLPTNFFKGSTTGNVQRCIACPKPTALLSGPALVVEPCLEGEMVPTFISGSDSFDPSGRPFIDVQWAAVSAPDTLSQNHLSSMVALTNAKTSVM